MIIRAHPFDNLLFHGKVKRDYIAFIPTWCDVEPHVLDFHQAEDRKRLSYGAIVLFFTMYLSRVFPYVNVMNWRLLKNCGRGKRIDVLASEFGCPRLYGAAPKRIYQVIDTLRILGSAPVMRDPCRQTIPSGTPCVRHRYAKADSSHSQRDGSVLYIVNWWSMKWGSQDATQGDRCGTVTGLPSTLPEIHQ